METIIWSAFGIATLYISGIMPIHKIIPNFTIVAFEKGYYFARLRKTLEAVDAWMWFRILPASMMIISGGIVLFDLIDQNLFCKKSIDFTY
ncbi:hypothetical protein LW135_07435 [Helicobacter sp. faydin-H20]|uniref:hypothetical protein n=1 Tax=Helicobacter anatolicus TaxID=2905874 RepID=UPI001E4E0A64|nr:hypothetical protein [Helicobacter anatolicus]MCE3037652.1 hypothetical protein [Helicobacter anatolicus]